LLLSGWVDFHKGGVNLDEGGVWGFGIAIEGERTGKEEKRERRKGKKKEKWVGTIFF